MEKKLFVLNDDELEGVSGGLEAAVTGRGTYITTCDNFVCVWCGQGRQTLTGASHICPKQGDCDEYGKPIPMSFDNTCDNCEYLHSCGQANSYRPAGVALPPRG